MLLRNPSRARRGQGPPWLAIVLTALVTFVIAVPLTLFGVVGVGVVSWRQEVAAAAQRAEAAEQAARMNEQMAQEQATKASRAEAMARTQLEEARAAEAKARRDAEAKGKLAGEEAQKAIAEALLGLELRLYQTRIALAQQLAQGPEKDRARKLLAECPEQLRGWEWKLLNRQIDDEPRALRWPVDDPRSEARHLAFLPPNKPFIAAAGGDKKVHVWSAIDGEKAAAFDAEPDEVNAFAFSPDGKLFATSGTENVATVRDTEKGEVKCQLKGHEKWIPALAFNPEEARDEIATGGNDTTVRTWSASTGQPKATLTSHKEHVSCVAYSPDGTRLASGSFDHTVKVWGLVEKKELLTLEGHKDNVLAVAFSPNGKLIASAGTDRTVRIWNAATGKELFVLEGHKDAVVGLAFHPLGGRLASGSGDGTVRLWDTVTGSEVLTLSAHVKGVHALTFSPNGRMLATAGRDFERGPEQVKLWDSAAKE